MVDMRPFAGEWAPERRWETLCLLGNTCHEREWYSRVLQRFTWSALGSLDHLVGMAHPNTNMLPAGTTNPLALSASVMLSILVPLPCHN